MPSGSTVYISFNRGIVSRLGLARVDIKRVALSAERMVNWMPRVLGSMSIRPGLWYRGASRANLPAKYIPFVFASDDTAAIEITDGKMRIWVGDVLLSRQSVSAAVLNGNFTLSLNNWLDVGAGGSSTWNASQMSLTGTGTAAAARRQEVPFPGDDSGKVHALRVSVFRGPATFKVGTNAGEQNVFSEASLGTGSHSLAFTPVAAMSSTNIGPYLTLTNNTTLTMGASSGLSRSVGALKYALGPASKYYFEVKMTVLGSEQSSGVHVGVATFAGDTTTAVGQGTNSWGYWSSDGRVYYGGAIIATGSAWGLNDVIGVALDVSARTMALYLNNVLQVTVPNVGSAGSSYYPAVSFNAINRTVTVGLTVSGCTYSPPPGFSYWGGSFFVEFQNRLSRQVLVDSCEVESAGTVELDAPWTTSDLGLIRHDQSGDVVFVACQGRQQRRIERRSNGSWSVVLFAPEDGPFRIENVSTTTLTPSAISGNITLTASTPVFRDGHVGALFSLTSEGQRVERLVSSQDSWTDPIRVTGVGTERAFTVIRSGTWSATVTLQRSMDAPGDWSDVTTYSTNGTVTFDDTLDNQVAYYRIGVKTSQYSSGAALLTLSYGQGSITGVARITSVTSTTLASAEVVKDLGGTLATSVWAEGEWSTYRGWPTAVAFHEGRLWWAGKDGIWGSVSDAFDSHDPTYEGDAGPISRTIGSGPVDTISWLLSIQRLVAGGEGAEFSCRSSSFDEPLTPTNFNLRRISTQGSARVPGTLVDSRGLFVQRGGVRVFELSFDTETYDYSANHISMLVPSIGSPGIVAQAVQRQPDTRVHFVRSDGTVAVLVYDKPENVLCWVEVETDGEVEDVFVLPSDTGEEDDHVYYLVKRNVNGSDVRYLERWAQEADCHGGSVSRLADAHVVFSGSPVQTVTGLSHLEGESVIVWADGEDLGTFTVSSGQITLPSAKQNIVVGLPYEAQWKSGKLSQLQGIALTRDQQIQGLGLILADTHANGLTFGPDFNHMDELPVIVDGSVTADDTIHTAYDEGMVAIPGTWSTDSRICLQAQAPRPCTVLAAVADGEVNG